MSSTATAEPGTLASWAGGIVEALAQRGIEPARTLAAAGLSDEVFHATGARLSLTQISHLWAFAVEQAGDTIGLEAGRRIRVQSWQTLGIGLMSSRDPQDWFRRAVRYLPLVTDGVDLCLQTQDGGGLCCEARFRVAVPFEDVRMDCLMVSGVDMLRLLFADAPDRLQVALRRAPPADPEPWHRALGPRIVWNAAVCSVGLDNTRSRVAAPDPRWLQLHERLLSDALERLRGGEPVQRVRAEIAAALPRGEPTMDAIAARMSISRRTLQRRLSESGASFSELLDAARREFAQAYLLQGIPSREVTYLLGFSEPTNFHKAFRRWTGQTPRQFIERHADTLDSRSGAAPLTRSGRR